MMNKESSIYTRVQKSENLIQTINIIKTLENYIPIILSNWMIECSQKFFISSFVMVQSQKLTQRLYRIIFIQVFKLTKNSTKNKVLFKLYVYKGFFVKKKIFYTSFLTANTNFLTCCFFLHSFSKFILKNVISELDIESYKCILFIKTILQKTLCSRKKAHRSKW